MPKLKEAPEYTALRESCADYVTYMITPGLEKQNRNDNYQLTIFENALKLIYGPGILAAIDKQITENIREELMNELERNKP